MQKHAKDVHDKKQIVNSKRPYPLMVQLFLLVPATVAKVSKDFSCTKIENLPSSLFRVILSENKQNNMYQKISNGNIILNV